jgi:hypothetical protein
LKCFEAVPSDEERGILAGFERWEVGMAVAGFGVKNEAMDFCFLPEAKDA